jgi:hypothetical protein
MYICVCAAGDIYANGRFIFARYSPLYFLCSLGKEKAKAKELQQLLFYLFASRSTGEYAWHEFVLCVSVLYGCVYVCVEMKALFQQVNTPPNFAIFAGAFYCCCGPSARKEENPERRSAYMLMFSLFLCQQSLDA